jgi:hypothetical protein
MIKIIIGIQNIGSDAGPFDLYLKTTGGIFDISAFEIGVSRDDMLVGYEVSVPEDTIEIKAQSSGVCDNYIIIPVILNLTTTTTTPF